MGGSSVDRDSQRKMVGRERELATLVAHLEGAIQGKGRLVLISGEAGIGKTRLVEELKGIATEKGFAVLSGYGAYESLTPFMPFFDALRSGGYEHLFAEDVPRVEGVYLATDTGLLVTKALREDTRLDPDIFASMLKTVGDFVAESMAMLRGTSSSGTLDRLSSGGYTFLIERGPDVSLVVVLHGRENEFLIDDMRATLDEVHRRYSRVLRPWDGDDASVAGIDECLRPFIASGKYDGVYYARDDAKIRRTRLFDHVSLGLTRLAEDRPILLCLEDLQWADPSTLALLHYLARTTRTSAVLLVGTYRPEDLARQNGERHPLVEAMGRMDREGLDVALELHRLGEGETARLVASFLGGAELGEEIEARVYRGTGGVPFFVVELLKFIVAEGILRDDDGTWKMSKRLEAAGVPSRVRDTVSRRLSLIPERERAVLDLASVVGEEFDPDLLAVALGADRVQVLKSLRALEQPHGLVRTHDGRYKFDHVIIKEVLYGELPGGLREEYHSIVADALVKRVSESLDEAAGDIAFHYFRSRNRSMALPYLHVAAERAAKQYANEEAVRFYSEILAIEKDPAKRMTVFESLGAVYELTGDTEGALQAYRHALESAQENRKKAGLLARIGAVLRTKGEYAECIKLCTEASNLVSGEVCSEASLAFQVLGRACLAPGEYEKTLDCYEKSLAIRETMGDQRGIASVLDDIGFVHADRGEYEKALDHHRRSLGIREAIGDRRGVAIALSHIGYVHRERGEYDQALRCYRENLAIREAIGDRRGIGAALDDIGIVHAERGEYEKALEHHRRSLPIFERVGDRRSVAVALGYLGTVHKERGEYDQALRCYRENLEIREAIGDLRGVGIALAYIGLVDKECGAYRESLDHYTRALEILEKAGDRGDVAVVLSNMGAVHAEQGNYDKGFECASRGLDIAEGIGQEASTMGARVILAEILLKMGDETKAWDQCATAHASAVRMNLKRYISEADRIAGVIQAQRGKWEDSVKRFEESVRISSAIGCPFAEGKSRLEFGLMWRAKGDTDRARGLLAAAAELFSRIRANGELSRTQSAIADLPAQETNARSRA